MIVISQGILKFEVNTNINEKEFRKQLENFFLIGFIVSLDICDELIRKFYLK